jgi:peptidyl-prolyl cis-trans isomerase SurA
MMAPRLFVFFAALLALSPALAKPNSGETIVALVNGEIITQHDLDEKTKLALVTSGLSDTPEMRARVVGPLLHRMVDEDLKIQAAAKEKLTITPEDIASQLSSLDEQNHLPPGGLVKLLTAKGVNPDALRQQLRAEIAWSKLVHYALIKRVHVSENAVQTRLEALKANLGKPEYLVSEIFLAVDDPKSEPQVHDLAERLTEQMHQGAPLEAIARQFNQAGAADGNLGWVSYGMLDDDLLKVLGTLEPKGVSAPIRTPDGYHILNLREKRKVGEGWGGGATVDLMIIDLNSLASAGQAERDSQMQRLRDFLAPAKNCDDLATLSKQSPSASVDLREKLPESQLPPKVVPLIKDLGPGRISEPIETAKGRRFFAVCGRGTGNSEAPSAEDIRRQMEDEQLELVARRYLMTMQADAIIDIRQ